MATVCIPSCESLIITVLIIAIVACVCSTIMAMYCWHRRRREITLATANGHAAKRRYCLCAFKRPYTSCVLDRVVFNPNSGQMEWDMYLGRSQRGSEHRSTNGSFK